MSSQSASDSLVNPAFVRTMAAYNAEIIRAGLLSMLAWHERMLQLIERPDPSTAPLESDPPRKAERRPSRT